MGLLHDIFGEKKIQFKRIKGRLFAEKSASEKVTVEDLVNDLWSIDCSVDFHQTGWGYIIDENSNAVYEITDYNFNKLEELNDKGKVLFPLANLKPKDFQ